MTDERLAEVFEVESLMKRYCLYFDTKNAQSLGELFTQDARIDYGPEVEPIRGRENLVRMVESGALDSSRPTTVLVTRLLPLQVRAVQRGRVISMPGTSISTAK